MNNELVKVKAKMVEEGVTQIILAEAVGCSATTINYKLNGISPLTREDIVAIAEKLHINQSEYVEYFF